MVAPHNHFQEACSLPASAHIDSGPLHPPITHHAPSSLPAQYQADPPSPSARPTLPLLCDHRSFQYSLTSAQFHGDWSVPFVHPTKGGVKSIDRDAERRAADNWARAPLVLGTLPTSFAPVWRTEGPIAGTFRMVEVPVVSSFSLHQLKEPCKIPPPVFPSGSLDNVLAARSLRTFYIVTTGFCIGVWTTFELGSQQSTDKCPKSRHSSYNCDYPTACRVFMDMVDRGLVHTVAFTTPDALTH
jgi:hypothetical protein